MSARRFSVSVSTLRSVHTLPGENTPTGRSDRLRRLAPLLSCAGVMAVTASALSGCSGTVPMDPAPHADDPACAEITVRLPETLGGEQKRRTNAQATGAWGDPAKILLSCGVREPQVSSQACVTVDDVDWLVDDSDDPTYRFTSYGRSPATELVIDSTTVSGNSVLAEISPAVQRIPAAKRCQ